MVTRIILIIPHKPLYTTYWIWIYEQNILEQLKITIRIIINWLNRLFKTGSSFFAVSAETFVGSNTPVGYWMTKKISFAIASFRSTLFATIANRLISIAVIFTVLFTRFCFFPFRIRTYQTHYQNELIEHNEN